MIVLGIIYTALTQGGDSVTLLLNSGIEKAFELFFTLAPIMAFWSGIMEIASRSGATELISKLLSPLTSLLFGKKYKNSPVMGKISMNMSANLLGMGNAATPLGLSAIKALDSINPHPDTLSRAMCMFIIVNTASIQIIPSSVIALRAQYGSSSPSDIIIPTIVTTLSAFCAGTLSARLCERGSRYE